MNNLISIDSQTFTDFIPQPYQVKSHYFQWKITPPVAYNDQVFPPYLYPNCGFNTIDVSGGIYAEHWTVMSCAGSIVSWLESDRPDSLSCVSASGASYSYLIRQGFTNGDNIIGDWLTAGSPTSKGNTWFIGTFAGVDYWFIPAGFVMEADTIPTIYVDSGIFVFAKALGYGDSFRYGIAINKWDGSYRFGTLASHLTADHTGSLTGLYAYPGADFKRNGVAFSSANQDSQNNRKYNEPVPQLFSVVVPSKEVTSENSVNTNILGQFTGVLITPVNAVNNTNISLSLNVS